MTTAIIESTHALRVKPCEMSKSYPDTAPCARPTSKGWRGLGGKVIAACDDCLKNPRFSIAEHRIEPL